MSNLLQRNVFNRFLIYYFNILFYCSNLFLSWQWGFSFSFGDYDMFCKNGRVSLWKLTGEFTTRRSPINPILKVIVFVRKLRKTISVSYYILILRTYYFYDRTLWLSKIHAEVWIGHFCLSKLSFVYTLVDRYARFLSYRNKLLKTCKIVDKQSVKNNNRFRTLGRYCLQPAEEKLLCEVIV